MAKQKVCLEFSGHIEVEIGDIEPDADVETWQEAIADAWFGLSKAQVYDAAELTGHEIVE